MSYYNSAVATAITRRRQGTMLRSMGCIAANRDAGRGTCQEALRPGEHEPKGAEACPTMGSASPTFLAAAVLLKIDAHLKGKEVAA